MESILVGTNDAALASGALVNATTSLGISDNSLGVLSWDFDGTTPLGTFLTPGDEVTEAIAIKVLQGTANSSNIQNVNLFEVGEQKFKESGIIHRDYIRSFSAVIPRYGAYDSDILTGFTTPVSDVEYKAYVQLSSYRSDRDYSDNDQVLHYTLPAFDLSGVDSETDKVLQELVSEINTRSRLFNVTGVNASNRNLVAFGINTAGSFGQPLGTIANGTQITLATVNGTDVTYTADLQFVRTVAEWINASDLTVSSTIEAIDLTTAGDAVAATGTITITDFSALSTDTVTINGTALVEATDWAAGASNNAAATALAAAIDGVTGVNATANAAVITVTATTAGTAGNAITMAYTSGGTAGLTLSGATLTNGADDKVDAIVVMGLDEPLPAIFSDIKEVRTKVETNLGGGFRATGYNFTRTHFNGEEDVNTGRQWWVENRDRAQLRVHTMQNQPHGDFFTEGTVYVDPNQAFYLAYILDYYDFEETLTVRTQSPKQLVILTPAIEDFGSDTVADALSNIVGGNNAINMTTDTATLTAALQATLGVWLESARPYSAFTLKGDATSASYFDIV